MLDKQENGSSGTKIRRFFHNFFSFDNLLITPMLIIMVVIMVAVFSGGLKKESPSGTNPTNITESIITTKENTTKEETTEKAVQESTAEISTVETSTTKTYTTEKETIKQTTISEQTTETKKTTQKEPDTTIKSQYPSNFGSFKSYTDYRCLSRSSAQWKLQEQAYTDENGLRKIGDAYLVAMGSYYGTTLSTTYQVTLSSGNSFTVMLCDSKADRHTDANNQVCSSNGSVIEFYVESDKMPSIVRQMGSVGALSQFSGSIVSIEKTA